MAQRVVVKYVDDITGEEGASTHRFGYAGTEYEIDLVDGNSEKLRQALDPFIQAARKASPSRQRSSGGASRPSPTRKNDPAKVREWARENGHTISERGRVPAEVTAAYEAAHN